MSIEKNIPIETGRVDSESRIRLLQHFNLPVVFSILALAALLGVLNNLRTAPERKVKWFSAPADHNVQESAEKAFP